MASYQPA